MTILAEAAGFRVASTDCARLSESFLQMLKTAELACAPLTGLNWTCDSFRVESGKESLTQGAMCPAWMTGGMLIGGLPGVLLIVLLVGATVKVVRS